MNILTGIMGLIVFGFIELIKILSIGAGLTGMIVIPIGLIVNRIKDEPETYENLNKLTDNILKYYIRVFPVITLVIGYYDLHQLGII